MFETSVSIPDENIRKWGKQQLIRDREENTVNHGRIQVFVDLHSKVRKHVLMVPSSIKQVYRPKYVGGYWIWIAISIM